MEVVKINLEKSIWVKKKSNLRKRITLFLRPSKYYRCAKCENIYVKGWSDEESNKEYEENFGYLETDDRVLVCDDCFKEMDPNTLYGHKIEIIESYEQLLVFINKELPGYHPFITELNEPFFLTPYVFDKAIFIAKEERFFVDTLTIDIDEYNIEVQTKNTILKLRGFCISPTVSIPFFEAIDKNIQKEEKESPELPIEFEKDLQKLTEAFVEKWTNQWHLFFPGGNPDDDNFEFFGKEEEEEE